MRYVFTPNNAHRVLGRWAGWGGGGRANFLHRQLKSKVAAGVSRWCRVREAGPCGSSSPAQKSQELNWDLLEEIIRIIES